MNVIINFFEIVSVITSILSKSNTGNYHRALRISIVVPKYKHLTKCNYSVIK